MNKQSFSLLKRQSAAELFIRVQYFFAPRLRKGLIIFTALLLLSQTITAQETARADSVSKPKHSARKATLYSMALPGLGQAYNKKYWKIPVIYAGFGTLTYFIISNNKKYGDFKEAYRYKADTANNPYPFGNPYIEKYDASQLLEGQNYFRRNLEVSVMLTAVLYILNVVDAAVDAHFFDFSIDDDISLHVQPYMNPSPFASKQNGGLRLTLSF